MEEYYEVELFERFFFQRIDDWVTPFRSVDKADVEKRVRQLNESRTPQERLLYEYRCSEAKTIEDVLRRISDFEW